MTAKEQWVNCLVQGQNDRFLPCQLRDSILQPFGYKSNALTTRLPAAPSINVYCCQGNNRTFYAGAEFYCLKR